MSRRPKITLTAVLVSVGIVALLISIVLPILDRLRQTSGIVPCASNMRVIGQALLLYSLEHGGRYPQRLDELLGYDWSPSKDRFVCAVSGKPVLFIAPRAVKADLTCDDVVAYEPLPAHDGEGSDVLYGDGHVTWLTAVELERELVRSTTRAATRHASTRT
jgi:prepilin-type processing-associated H-X9-DG protein